MFLYLTEYIINTKIPNKVTAAKLHLNVHCFMVQYTIIASIGLV